MATGPETGTDAGPITAANVGSVSSSAHRKPMVARIVRDVRGSIVTFPTSGRQVNESRAVTLARSRATSTGWSPAL